MTFADKYPNFTAEDRYTALLPGEDEDAEELDGYHGQGELGNGGPGHPQLHLQYSDLQYTVSLNAVLRG